MFRAITSEDLDKSVRTVLDPDASGDEKTEALNALRKYTLEEVFHTLQNISRWVKVRHWICSSCEGKNSGSSLSSFNEVTNVELETD